MRNQVVAGMLVLAGVIALGNASGAERKRVPGPVRQGTLLAVNGHGEAGADCPLKHTSVKADISGFMARVTVTQEFNNTASDKIEAVYVFPLPHMAAVDRMDLYVGERHIKGDIKRREEARAIYEAARDAGKMAALLDQERPNIFTQHVSNIRPGEKVRIEISYVERLKYEQGEYEWLFPMVVGPRYIPGQQIGRGAGGWSFDTDQVPDASRITPPVALPGTRAGHDIDVAVKIDAGLPLQSLASKTHSVSTERPDPQRAVVRLKDQAVIPNKDFVLRYDVAGPKLSDALLTHRDQRGGFFTLILQPPDTPTPQEIAPKELVFVLDTSGSMSGFPIEKAKETMKLALDALNPRDTFNLITFSGDTRILFPEPAPATPENRHAAQQFLAGQRGSGGTEMMKAITAALAPASNRHIRVVCFMTDGYVGNEAAILSEIQRYPEARVFSFGIGNSANRYLLDKMAETGRGEVEYVALNDDGSAAAKRFHERVRNPLLTDIRLDWGDLPVTDVYPARIPDVFSAKPIVITGRYTGPAKGTLHLRGTYAGRPYTRDILVDLPAEQRNHDVLATLWARARVDNLMSDDSKREEITQLGLKYRLMTPFTSFVAVEETIVTEGGKPRRVDVPVEAPDGVAYEGVFGQALAERVQPVRFAQRMIHTPGFVAGAPPTGTHLAIMPPAAPARPKTSGNAPLKLDPTLLRHTGEVLVQVWLSDASDAVFEKLKAAYGFHMVSKSASMKMTIGRIDVSKLQALSEQVFIKYIAPAPATK